MYLFVYLWHTVKIVSYNVALHAFQFTCLISQFLFGSVKFLFKQQLNSPHLYFLYVDNPNYIRKNYFTDTRLFYSFIFLSVYSFLSLSNLSFSLSLSFSWFYIHLQKLVCKGFLLSFFKIWIVYCSNIFAYFVGRRISQY